MKSIIILDYEEVYRLGLRAILEPHYRVIEHVPKGETYPDLKSVALAIVAPEHDGLDGLWMLKRIRQEYPKLPLLVLSNDNDTTYPYRCVRVGATGLLRKSVTGKEILKAVETLLGGFCVLPVGCTDTFNKTALSDREMQTLKLLGQGKSVGEIAHDFKLSVKTISTYRVRCLSKLKLKSTGELMRYAIKEGLVE